MVVTHEPRDRVVQWLSLSLLLHLFLIFLFCIEVEREQSLQPAPVVFYEEPETQASQLPPAMPQPLAQPLPPPPAVPKPQDEDKELDFALDLHENSKFGITKIFNEQPIIGNDPTAVASDIPLGEDGIEEQTHEQALDVPTEAEPEQAAPTPLEQPMAAVEKPVAQTPTEEPLATPTPGPQRVEQLAQKQPMQAAFPFTRKVKVRRKKSAGPITKNVTLADLAEGFLNYVKENDSQPIDINTNDYKYIGYMQKIGWFLQNSFHLHNRPLTLDHDVHMQTELHIAIDENGNIAKSWFFPEVDEYVLHNHLMKIVKGAAPFPPLPKHFSQKNIKIKLPIRIAAARGTHTYFFTFRG